MPLQSAAISPLRSATKAAATKERNSHVFEVVVPQYLEPRRSAARHRRRIAAIAIGSAVAAYGCAGLPETNDDGQTSAGRGGKGGTSSRGGTGFGGAISTGGASGSSGTAGNGYAGNAGNGTGNAGGRDGNAGSGGSSGGGSCVPVDCTPEGGTYCGEIGDGCGASLDCGVCTGDWTCEEHVCLGGPSCVPNTMCTDGSTTFCGIIGDGCGRSVECPTCPGGTTCGGGGLERVCGAPDCPTLVDCNNAAGEQQYCGRIGSGCGGVLECPATCANGMACGADAPHVCPGVSGM